MLRFPLFVVNLPIMKTTFDLVQDLRSIPDSVYQDFCNQAKIVALEYPSAHGIDCFARGETIEFGFVETIGQYIDLKPNQKLDFNDPDGIYASEHLTDVKTQGNGFIPRKDQKARFILNNGTLKRLPLVPNSLNLNHIHIF